MHVLIAPQSFKGSLSAARVAEAISMGVKRVFPDASVDLVPLADGGEGTVEALVAATGGEFKQALVTGPLGEKVTAQLGILGNRETAVIEMAAVSGLGLVPSQRRNPLVATTFGTGELIKAALDAGCRRLVIGIGGSATNDGGAGMAQALGAHLLDAQGEEIGPGGAELLRLDRISTEGLDQRLKQVEVIVASDVSNPLCGQQGASAVYGPQKGATPEMVQVLDLALAHYAAVVSKDLGVDVKDLPGAGAAGGLGAGLVAFLGASLRPGIDIVMEAAGLRWRLSSADLVISGEGQIDSQTVSGKTISGVGRIAGEAGVPVIAVAGSLGEGFEAVFDYGVRGVVAAVPGPIDLATAMENAFDNVAKATENAMRLLRLGMWMGQWGTD